MSFNSEIVVRIVQTVSGQQGSSIHVSSESGNALWTSKCDKVSFFSPQSFGQIILKNTGLILNGLRKF